MIVCAGQQSRYELEAPLIAAGVRVHRIGGAAYAGELDAKRAIDMGTRLAAQIEEARAGPRAEVPSPPSPVAAAAEAIVRPHRAPRHGGTAPYPASLYVSSLHVMPTDPQAKPGDALKMGPPVHFAEKVVGKLLKMR